MWHCDSNRLCDENLPKKRTSKINVYLIIPYIYGSNLANNIGNSDYYYINVPNGVKI